MKRREQIDVTPDLVLKKHRAGRPVSEMMEADWIWTGTAIVNRGEV